MNDQQTTIDEMKQKIMDFRRARAWEREDAKDMALSLVLEAVELFGKDVSPEEKRRAYYRVKAATRGGHPLAEKE
jgi:hypothetical protein